MWCWRIWRLLSWHDDLFEGRRLRGGALCGILLSVAWQGVALLFELLLTGLGRTCDKACVATPAGCECLLQESCVTGDACLLGVLHLACIVPTCVLTRGRLQLSHTCRYRSE